MAVIRDSIPVVPGPGTRGGWVKPLDRLVDQLEADAEGLRERLDRGLVGGTPAAYSAKRIFNAETEQISATQWNIPQPLNYVVRDGQTYDIPIVFPGPGVFLARKMTVTCYQRLYCPQYRHEMRIAMSSVDMPMLGHNYAGGGTPLDGALTDATYKLSVFPTLPALPNNSTPRRAGYVIKPGINFFWNVQDSKSGAWLADDMMSHLALLPRTFQPVSYSGAGFSDSLAFYNSQTPFPMADGSLFYFSAPWLVERDGQMNFRFRPHTPVLQYDSSVNIATDLGVRSFSFDDRAVGSSGLLGLRNQAVTVQVEVHGRRYESMQDLKHAGALSR